MGIARAGRVADDRREVDDSLGAVEGARAGVAVADVASDHFDAGALLLGRDVLLAVEQ